MQQDQQQQKSSKDRAGQTPADSGGCHLFPTTARVVGTLAALPLALRQMPAPAQSVPGFLPIQAVVTAPATSVTPIEVEAAADLVGKVDINQPLYVTNPENYPPHVQQSLALLAQELQKHNLDPENRAKFLVYLTDETSPQGGPDAILESLDDAILSSPSVLQLGDPATGLSNVSFIALSVTEGSLGSLSTGELLADLGLADEQIWNGELYREFADNMRQGQQVYNAVLQTVLSVEALLDQKQEEREQALETAAKELETARSSVTALSSQVDAVEQEMTERQRSGSLATPPLDEFETTLREAEASLSSGDFQTARERIRSVQSEVSDLNQSLARVVADRSEFLSLAESLQSVVAQEDADLIEEEIASADRVLAEALERYEAGNSYLDDLQNAKREINALEGELAEAQADLQRAQFIAKALGVGIPGLLTVSVGAGIVVANRRRREKMVEAFKAFANQSSAVKERDEAIWDGLVRRSGDYKRSSDAGGQVNRFPEGNRSHELAESAFAKVDEALLLVEAAKAHLKEINLTLRPAEAVGKGDFGASSHVVENFLRSAPFERALAALQTEAISYQVGSPVYEIVNGERTVQDSLMAKPEEYTFSLTLPQLLSELQEVSLEADAALNELEEAETKFIERKKAVEGALTSIAMKFHEHVTSSAEEEVFTLTSGEDFVRQLRAKVQKAQDLAADDPATAYLKINEVGRSILDAQNLLKASASVREETLPAIRQNKETLASIARVSGEDGAQRSLLATDWIDQRLTTLSFEANQLLTNAVREPLTRTQRGDEALSVIPPLPTLLAKFDALKEQVDDAVTESVAWEQIHKQRLTTLDRVGAMRKRYAEELRLEENQILTEDNFNPNDSLLAAAQSELEAWQQLNQGEVDAAKASLTSTSESVNLAAAIVEESEASFLSHTEEVKRLTTQIAKIEEAVGAVDEDSGIANILRVLSTRYKESALEFRKGDATHPEADNTALNNAEEVRTHLQQMRAGVTAAETTFGSGKLLEAATERDKVEANYQLSLHRIAEVKEKAKALAQVVASNELAGESLPLDQGETARYVDRHTSTQATAEAYQEAKVAATAALEAATQATTSNEKSDPFEIQNSLRHAARLFAQVREMAEQDEEDYETAAKVAATAKTHLAGVETLATQTEQDSYADSATLDSAQEKLKTLTARFTEVNSLFSASSDTQLSTLELNSWSDALDKLEEIKEEAAQIAATIRGEMKALEAALQALKQAKAQVKSAKGWRRQNLSQAQRFNISIGSSGSAGLTEAEAALAQGRYEEASKKAARAKSTASRSINAANTALTSAVQAEERRLAKLRKEREMRQQSLHSASSLSSPNISSTNRSWGGSSSHTSTNRSWSSPSSSHTSTNRGW